MTTKQHLTHLESTSLIRLAQTHPELEFIFRHAKLRESFLNLPNVRTVLEDKINL